MKNYLKNEETKKIDPVYPGVDYQQKGTSLELFKIFFFKNKQETLDELINGSKSTIYSRN